MTKFRGRFTARQGLSDLTFGRWQPLRGSGNVHVLGGGSGKRNESRIVQEIVQNTMILRLRVADTSVV
ncbi:hypothetical protein QG37_03046 [Candidozyma auris]|nr:hypothetical protein QG37_03046 [[Candida] auris]